MLGAPSPHQGTNQSNTALCELGKFTVHVRTMCKRLRRNFTAVAEWCQEHRHDSVDEQQKTLNAKLRGHYQYYGRPPNSRSLLKFYRGVVRIWRKWLNRRTRGNRLTWERYTALVRLASSAAASDLLPYHRDLRSACGTGA